MKALKVLWRKLTQTEALKKSSGELETLFFESTYRVAYIVGLSSVDRGLLYLLYSRMVKIAIVLLVLAEILFLVFDSANLDEIAASLNVIVIQSIAYYRYKNMLIYRDFYRKLAVAMSSPTFDITTAKRKKIVDYWAQVNESYLKLLLGIGNLTLLAWFSYPLLDDVEYNMIVGLKLGFNYRNPRAYAVTYVILIVVFTYVSHFVMVTDIRMQTHFLHLICQFNVLASCFENVLEDCKMSFKGTAIKLFNTESSLYVNKKFQDKYKKRLSDLVDQHKFILKLVMELRTTLSGPMLGQLAASSVLICFIGYQAATTVTDNITKCLMSLFFLGYNLFGFYIICRWCEEIKTQSESIGTAVYCSGWETGVAVIPSVRSILMLVIMRANKTVSIKAGGMYELSLMSYSSLVKASYTALTVLLRFRN